MSSTVAPALSGTDPPRTLHALPPGSGWYQIQASSHPSEASLVVDRIEVDAAAEVMRGVAFRLSDPRPLVPDAAAGDEPFGNGVGA